jgi:nucleotide-binding universal stress UspA family protein
MRILGAIVETTANNVAIGHPYLFIVASGAPVLIAPANWSQRGAAIRALVAWDESASAARAVRGALALLIEAQSVEVVCVTGDKVMPSVTPGADLAQYLARHCRIVTETEIPMENADAAATLRQHASLTRADLLVLGGYGHSRFREFVLGGVTRSMLHEIAIQTLMAH